MTTITNIKETTMKPRFEEHNSQLFRMLDEPEPLTTDAELPCLTRLIQDDSRMGMFNRDTKPNRLSDFYLAARIVNNNIIVDKFMESDYHRFEIIGYPVVEGSHWWALYSAMNGKSFVHKDAKQCRIFTMFSETELRVTNEEGELVEFVDIDRFLSEEAKDGWEIYEEPELQYKVGDWVEIINLYSGAKHLGQIDYIDHEIHIGTHRFDISGKSVTERLPQFRINNKLKPSEVIVDIGCLSGTVKDLSYAEDGRFWFIGGKTERCPGGMHCILYLEMLDTTTSKLVESLLKAQEEEK